MTSNDKADIHATLSRIQAAKRKQATEFALKDAEISRETLAEVATISSLQSLSLSLDFFEEEETLPKITDISAISSLTSLTTLDISHFRHLMDLTPIKFLPKLKDLKLYYCPALDDLCPLSACTRLEYLDLSLCYKIADLTPLAGLSSLRSLQAPYCTKLKDLLPLAGLTSLEKLLLYGSENLFDPLRNVRVTAATCACRQKVPLALSATEVGFLTGTFQTGSVGSGSQTTPCISLRASGWGPDCLIRREGRRADAMDAMGRSLLGGPESLGRATTAG